MLSGKSVLALVLAVLVVSAAAGLYVYDNKHNSPSEKTASYPLWVQVIPDGAQSAYVVDLQGLKTNPYLNAELKNLSKILGENLTWDSLLSSDKEDAVWLNKTTQFVVFTYGAHKVATDCEYWFSSENNETEKNCTYETVPYVGAVIFGDFKNVNWTKFIYEGGDDVKKGEYMNVTYYYTDEDALIANDKLLIVVEKPIINVTIETMLGKHPFAKEFYEFSTQLPVKEVMYFTKNEKQFQKNLPSDVQMILRNFTVNTSLVKYSWGGIGFQAQGVKVVSYLEAVNDTAAVQIYNQTLTIQNRLLKMLNQYNQYFPGANELANVIKGMEIEKKGKIVFTSTVIPYKAINSIAEALARGFNG